MLIFNTLGDSYIEVKHVKTFCFFYQRVVGRWVIKNAEDWYKLDLPHDKTQFNDGVLERLYFSPSGGNTIDDLADDIYSMTQKDKPWPNLKIENSKIIDKFY